MRERHTVERDELLKELGIDPAQGLSSEEVRRLTEKHGYNEFEERKSESILTKIIFQLKDITAIILILAAVLSLALALREGHGFIEPAVIAAIVVMNMVLGITQEKSAERAIDALNRMNSPESLVVRHGSHEKLPSREIVPGDVLLVRSGDLIPADARLIESADLSVDESSLTGESEPAEKDAGYLAESDAAIGDRANMLYSGTLATAGRGKAVVTATGMKTEMGKIASYLNEGQKIKTPLQMRLDGLGRMISVVAVASAATLFALGRAQGEELWSMALLAVTLAVAAVPETLSLIVTLTLSHGVRNMVKKNALVRKLPAVETLGSTSVICSDKTGTLTQNRMAVKRLWAGSGEPLDENASFDGHTTDFINRLLLCSNAVARSDGGRVAIIGDPTESAILRLATSVGIARESAEAEYPRVAEIPFSSSRKMMTTVHEDPRGGYLVLTKGAFDRLPCKRGVDAEEARRRLDVHDGFAHDALRVIALASGHVDRLPSEGKLEAVERDLDFEGIVGIIDPPRPEAKRSIAEARRAGVRTVMITGDHAATAGAIARELGILSADERVVTGRELAELSDGELCRSVREYSVYARVSPEDKIRIVEAWQEDGEVVAMTGDGVNDAPALKAADVGVAMGINGTEVAKNAADVVLTDDNFATIVDAVREGRNVFSNIRKTVYFLLTCNMSEIIIILGAQLVGWGSPVTPALLLLINVLGDGIPGLHLARERSDPRIMERRPIGRDESFFDGGLAQAIVRQTVIFALVTWLGYYVGAFRILAEEYAPSHALGQSMAFLILGWTSILHIFTVRSRMSVFRRTLRDNPPLAVSAVVMLLAFAALVAFEPAAALFGLGAMSPLHWFYAVGFSLVPTAIAEAAKLADELADRRNYRRRLVAHRSGD